MLEQQRGEAKRRARDGLVSVVVDDPQKFARPLGIGDGGVMSRLYGPQRVAQTCRRAALADARRDAEAKALTPRLTDPEKRGYPG